MAEDEERPGFFKPFTKKVLRGLTKNEWNQFCNLQTNDERVGFCRGLSVVRDVQMSSEFHRKNKMEAQRKKDEGNKAYTQCDYIKAFNLYSQALVKADCELASLCAANRSACSFYLKHFIECLADIKLAFNLNYPNELRYKLLERRARCMIVLKQFLSAHKSLNEAMQALNETKLNEDQKTKKRNEFEAIKNAFAKEQLIDSQDKPSLMTKPPIPDVSTGVNPIYPAASTKLTFLDTPLFGRHAVSADKIRAGDTLLAEEAYASVLLPRLYTVHCQNCLQRVTISVPCTKCSGVIFCSISCRDTALNSYHKYECGVSQLLYTSGMSITCYLAFRLVTQHSVDFFLKLKPNLGKTPTGQYLTNDYLNIYNLISHQGRATNENIFFSALMATFMLHCLKMEGYFPEEKGSNSHEESVLQENFIGGLLLHHLQLGQYNAHEVSELKMIATDTIGDSESKSVGAAIYPTLALFNHSCEPSIVRYFSGSTVIVRAIKPLDRNEMVAENYGPLFTEERRDARQKYLKDRYEFECTCRACINDWPLFKELDPQVMQFKCATCRSQIRVTFDTMSPLFTCLACGHETNIMKALKILQDTEQTFRSGTRDIERGDIMRGMNLLLENLQRLDECLYPPHKDYHLCQQLIRKCMLTLGSIYVENT